MSVTARRGSWRRLTGGPAPLPEETRSGWLTRRHLEIALGLLWLIDGALQFQPYMFSRAFFVNVLGMAQMGNVPHLVALLNHDISVLMSSHVVAFNTIFATTQVAIGIGLLWSRSATIARIASIAWALGVWSVGEGFGGMFMPGMNPLEGAPGAVILYAAATLVLWPRRSEGDAVADVGLLGGIATRVLWTVLWTGTALLELEIANNAPNALSSQLTELAQGEPAPIAAMDHTVAHLMFGHGTELALLIMMSQVLIGSWVLRPGTRRLALGAGIAVAGIYWVIGQNFGGIFTGQGTDPNTGPLLVLLALSLWPRVRAQSCCAVSTRADAQGLDKEHVPSSDHEKESTPELAVTDYQNEQAHLVGLAVDHHDSDEADMSTIYSGQKASKSKANTPTPIGPSD